MLEVDGLTVRAGHATLVRGMTFDVAAGERVAIVGASGSGKSITASALVGVIPPGLTVTGDIRIAGHDVAGIPVPRRPRGARAAMVFQDSSSALAPSVTVGRHLDMAMRRTTSPGGRADAAATLLRRVGLDDPDRMLRARSSELSGGQRQRVCIALALASDAPVIVADEPTTALDVVSQHTVLGALHDATSGADAPALLMITHDIAIATSLCSRIVVVDDGRVVETISSSTILTRPCHPVTARLVAHARAADATLAVAS